MSLPSNRQWCLARRPTGDTTPADFEWRTTEIPKLREGEFLVRVVYLSVDPANRVWISPVPSYLPAVEIGDVVRGFAVGVVEESLHAGFLPGDRVQGLLGWQEYAVSTGASINKVHSDPRLPLAAHLGLLGHVGLTAYFGLLDVGRPREGDTLVVSGAAGAVGSLVGQIGKLVGCRVVGIAGSDEKCAWILEKLGFDAAINYRASSVLRGLMRHCRNGIDVYFDNVGGEILDAVLRLINFKARIVLCGMMSQYNSEAPRPGPSYLANAINKRARLEGFIVLDYFDRAQEATDQLIRWYAEKRITYNVEIVRGLEGAPDALRRLFDGRSHGKLLVQVSDETAA
jgi:NADPH-dependent curcumin reductase CurA